MFFGEKLTIKPNKAILQNYQSIFNSGEKSKSDESMTRIITVLHPIILLNGLFTYSPIIFLLLTSRIMQTNTTGRSIPLITWVHTEMEMSGALGIRMIQAEIARIEV